MTDLSVQLASGETGSSLLYKTLSAEVENLGYVDWPDTLELFKRRYVEALPLFEAKRLAHSDRRSITARLSEAMGRQLCVGESPLHEYLKKPAEPFKLQTIEGAGQTQLHLAYGDRDWRNFSDLSEHLFDAHVISHDAAHALRWVQSELVHDQRISLQGRKVVVLGAAAEMAATRLFLKCGADVLWLDRVLPQIQPSEFSGRLHVPRDGIDLLQQAAETLRTIQEFANGEPVDLCLYAYAPGQAREIRLTGAMNAMVDALPDSIIASVTLLVSPTTPSALDDHDLAVMSQRLKNRPGWERSLDAVGLLGRGGGFASYGGQHTVRTVVSIQGTSYQAAQYLGKIIAAERWHDDGLRVSANTAAITQTTSLQHPVFDAAFGGAAALQVQTLTPLQSQMLNGLLAIHDWLYPDPPTPGASRIHGGIHTLPYPLEAALKPAAAIGFAKSPKLLFGLLRA